MTSHTDPVIHPGASLRPPAPTPQPRPLGPIATLRTLLRNPLECWTEAHFAEPIVPGGYPFARVVVVSDPRAIREVLVENGAAYRKSAIERRVLSARMREGIVAVDGEQWQRQRRILAPLFGRKTVMAFAPAIARAAADLIRRWQRLPAGSTVEIKAEMSRVALETLLACLFSEGIGDPEPVRAATMRYFTTAGGIDPFDIIGLPDFVPRVTRLRSRSSLRDFDEALNGAIAELTSGDRTVDNALGVYRELAGGRLRLVGFKDVGADADTLRALTDAVHADGRTAFLEVVSTSRDGELRSIETAIGIGVDYVLGGTHVDEALSLLRGEKARYFPFPGTVVGHPSELCGSIGEIAGHAAHMTATPGVHGLDLLAYRNRTVDPARLVGAVVEATPAPVIVAGSLDSEARIRAVARAGAWGFTIGQAIFDGRLPGAPSIRAQVDWVLDVAGRAPSND